MRQNQEHGKSTGFTRLERQTIARQVLEGQMTRHTAAEKHQVAYPTLCLWVRKTQQEDAQRKVEIAEGTESQSAKQRIEALEKALAQANLKLEAQDILIDIGNQELGIDLRKKSGAKQ